VLLAVVWEYVGRPVDRTIARTLGNIEVLTQKSIEMQQSQHFPSIRPRQRDICSY